MSSSSDDDTLQADEQLYARLQQVAENPEQPKRIRMLAADALGSLHRARIEWEVFHDEKDNARRYRELLESIDLGIVIHDASGQVLYSNRAALHINHHPPCEESDSWRSPMNSLDWLAVDMQGIHLSRENYPANLALRTGKIQSGKVIGLYNIRKQVFRWIEITAIPYAAGSNDRPRQVLSILRDISEERRVYDMFERLQSLSETGCWDWDYASGECNLTPGALHILGLAQPPQSLDELLACFPQYETRRLARSIEKALNDQVPFTLELHRFDAFGEEQWVRLQGELDFLNPFTSRISGTLENISSSKQLEKSLRRKANTDPLTGLLNRDAIMEELEARLAGTLPKVALLYIDLDRFKEINDTLGHDYGDKLLQDVARRLVIATDDKAAMCARLGGDEFLVLCTAHESRAPQRLAEHLVELLSSPFQIGSETLHVSASIGIARTPKDGLDSATLMQKADAAMYESKRRGKNSWSAYDWELAKKQRRQVELDTLIRGAVQNQEIELLYQPILDVQSGQLVACEALLRWQSPILGTVATETLVAHAEASGEIVRIGGWALREACLQLRRWQNAGLPHVPVSVNVSFQQFLNENLLALVESALQAAELPGSALILELSERILVEKAPLTPQIIEHLRQMDVRLCIDDFGEQYSALNMLRQFPFQSLKLSRQFLHGVPDNPSDTALCRAISDIARNLGFTLIASGLETAAQLNFLKSLGTPQAQGFWYSPPLTADVFARQWLATDARPVPAG